MLTTKKYLKLTGTSKVTVDDKEVIAVSLDASVQGDGNSSVISTIINKDVYNANITACRADIDAFTALVRNLEDEEANGNEE